jgi:cytochrome c-type biogenesis protein CcsB
MIIDIPTVERLCANGCFGVLVLTTLYYWSKIFFTGEVNSNQIGLVGYGTALFCLTAHLLLRWFESGHFPLSNLYESLIFLAWCLLLLHIFIEKSMKTLLLGVLTSPAILCLVAFTDFSLPSELQKSSPLVPALQSNWLVMHVTVMIASYAALLVGCFSALAYLLFSWFLGSETKESKPNLVFESSLNSLSKKGKETSSFFSSPNLMTSVTKIQDEPSILVSPEAISSQKKLFFGDVNGPNEFWQRTTKPKNSLNFLPFLDNLSYRTIGIGFCFLTLGILSGAVWANETWGNYWSWDPKETWAFITWLTFAAYLHSRLIGGWSGSKSAWIASFGFFIVWICYLGVNLVGQGLHSYGFLQI